MKNISILNFIRSWSLGKNSSINKDLEQFMNIEISEV